MSRLTEEQIERRVEQLIDSIDELFMAGELTQKQYDANMEDVRRWADVRYARDVLRRPPY